MSQMMAVQARKPAQSTPASAAGALQRKCDKCRKKKPLLQREAAGPAPETVPPIVHEVLRSPGQPLDPSTRAFMEPRFGYDFSQVRVHTDAQAAESARAVNALAYTVERDVVFGRGQYAPQTAEGRGLMAHELTHVVEQHRGMASRGTVQRLGFWERIGVLFGLVEGRWSDEELLAYLQELDQWQGPEGRHDSDNKARTVVRRWMTGAAQFRLSPRRKIHLIVEMQEGATLGGDEEAILDLLENSDNGDLRIIFSANGIDVGDLNRDIHGANRRRLQAFYARRFQGGMAALLRGIVRVQGEPAAHAPVFAYRWSELWERLQSYYYLPNELASYVEHLQPAERQQAQSDMLAERGRQQANRNRLADHLAQLREPTSQSSGTTDVDLEIRRLELEIHRIDDRLQSLDLPLQTLFAHRAQRETPQTMAAAARVPTATEQARMQEALRPPQPRTATGQTRTFDPADAPRYEARLRTWLTDRINQLYTRLVTEQGGVTEHQQAEQAGRLQLMTHIANVSRREVDAVFGQFATSQNFVAGANIRDAFQQCEERLAALPSDAERQEFKRQLAIAHARYLLRAGTGHINREFAASPEYTATEAPANSEATIQQTLGEEYGQNDTERLYQIRRGWPGTHEPSTGTITLQIFRRATPAQDRRYLWKTFQVIIHEYLHRLKHQRYTDYANSFGRNSRQYDTLIEGVCSLLTETVWSNVRPRLPALRAQVEGQQYANLDFDPSRDVPNILDSRYASYVQAAELVRQTGIDRLYLAYFRGQLELIGGPGATP